MKQYFALAQEGGAASITIYGDITSWPWMESDVSAYLLSKQIDRIEAERIDVYINSYGGEVSEGLAIYNALKRHESKVVTHCDGFACSAASVVFMAGDERVMGDASLLMVHNAWTYASGNAEELRKAAADLDTISAAAANAYKAAVNISDEELTALLDGETWILPQDAVSWGFATNIETYEASGKPAASARDLVMARMAAKPEKQIDAKAIAAEVLSQITKSVPQAENKTLKFLEALTRREGEVK